MVEILVKVIMCHMIGDYVLQNDFIAKSKGTNFYHMFVHCVLYCVPFALVFGTNILLLTLFLSHIITDLLKAKFNVINYTQDQLIHFALMVGLYVL